MPTAAWQDLWAWASACKQAEALWEPLLKPICSKCRCRHSSKAIHRLRLPLRNPAGIATAVQPETPASFAHNAESPSRSFHNGPAPAAHKMPAISVSYAASLVLLNLFVTNAAVRYQPNRRRNSVPNAAILSPMMTNNNHLMRSF